MLNYNEFRTMNKGQYTQFGLSRAWKAYKKKHETSLGAHGTANEKKKPTNKKKPTHKKPKKPPQGKKPKDKKSNKQSDKDECQDITCPIGVKDTSILESGLSRVDTLIKAEMVISLLVYRIVEIRICYVRSIENGIIENLQTFCN
jgi:hypothetical protein